MQRMVGCRSLWLQVIVKAVTAFFEAVFFIKAMGLGAWHATIEHKAFAAAFLGKIASMVHEFDAVALSTFIFIGDNTGNIAGHA